MKVHVACQTDSDEATFPKLPLMAKFSPTTGAQITKSAIAAAVAESSSTSAQFSKTSEGTLRCMIKNFKSMTDPVRGPCKTIESVAWRIMVMPRQHMVQKKGAQKCLGFFLQCCPDAYSDSWSCRASADLRLISQKPGVPNFSRKTSHIYTAKENDWGYSCFMTWADILDESQGYIKDDKVILEVAVKADPPKNILTYDQFEKKIQDYMRLANMQSSRGFIDKAIEVNQSALKFCEDRSGNFKAELEAQKAKLIEMKLKESIERIEKAPSEEESLLNQNSLKQVLAYSAANKQSSTCKCSKASGNGKTKETSNTERDVTTQRSSTRSPPAKEAVSPKEPSSPPSGKVKTPSGRDADLANDAKCAPNIAASSSVTALDEVVAKAANEASKDGLLSSGSTSEGDCTKESIGNGNGEDVAKDGNAKQTSSNADDASTASVATQNSASALADSLKRLSRKRQSDTKDEPTCSSDDETVSYHGSTESEAESDVSASEFFGPETGLMSKREEQLLADAGDNATTRDTCDGCAAVVSGDVQAELASAQVNLSNAYCQTDVSMPTSLKTQAHQLEANATSDASTNFPNLPPPPPPYAPPKKQTAKKTTGCGSVATKCKDDERTSMKVDSMSLLSYIRAVEMAHKDAEKCNPQPAGADALSSDVDPATDIASFISSFDSSQQVMSALSVIGENCVNARRVAAKALELVGMLESRSKNPHLKLGLQKFALLAGEKFNDKSECEAAIGGVAEDALKVGLSSLAAAGGEEAAEAMNALFACAECPEDPTDYMLGVAAQRFECLVDVIMTHNTLVEDGVVSKLNYYADTITTRVGNLESEKEDLMHQLYEEQARNLRLSEKCETIQQEMRTLVKQEKEKHEKTMQVLKQKKNEMKQQEKIMKQQEKALKQGERNADMARELQEKVEQMTRELREMRSKHGEEVRKLRAELNATNEARKSAADELKARDVECSHVRSQLNERTHALKRAENALCAERKTSQSNIAAASERAKKAEVLCLEQRLNAGLAVLERSLREAVQRIKEAEVTQKRLSGTGSTAPLDDLRSSLEEWKAVRETIISMIATAKSEFGSQMDQVKAGKLMSQLPRITVPPPPTLPKVFKLAQYSSTQTQSLDSDKTSPSVPAKSVGVIGQTRRSTNAGVIGGPVSSGSLSAGSSMQSLSKAPAPPSPKTSSASTTPVGGLAGSGGSLEALSNSTTSGDVSQQSSSSSGGITLPPTWGFGWEGSSISMNPINELLNPSRPLASSSSTSTETTTPAANVTAQLSQPPPGFSALRGGLPTMQNGWEPPSREWLTSLPPPPPSVGLSNGNMSTPNRYVPFPGAPMPRSTGYQPTQWDNGWSSFGSHQPPADGSPDITKGLVENRRGFPPQRDVLLEAVRSHFPHISRETVQEYVSSFMLRNNCPSPQAVNLGEFLQYVAEIVSVKEMWNGVPNLPPMMQPPPNLMPHSSPNNAQVPGSHQSPPTRPQMRDASGN